MNKVFKSERPIKMNLIIGIAAFLLAILGAKGFQSIILIALGCFSLLFVYSLKSYTLEISCENDTLEFKAKNKTITKFSMAEIKDIHYKSGKVPQIIIITDKEYKVPDLTSNSEIKEFIEEIKTAYNIEAAAQY